jgi:hypothetical protein
MNKRIGNKHTINKRIGNKHIGKKRVGNKHICKEQESKAYESKEPREQSEWNNVQRNNIYNKQKPCVLCESSAYYFSLGKFSAQFIPGWGGGEGEGGGGGFFASSDTTQSRVPVMPGIFPYICSICERLEIIIHTYRNKYCRFTVDRL